MNPAGLRNAAREAWRDAVMVRRRNGVSFARQVVDCLQLRSAGISTSDYYKYDLFDRSRFPDLASRRTYRGWRFRTELRRFSDVRLQPIAYHKHILYRLLQSFGLPVPRIVALYNPRPDGFERNRALLVEEDLRAFLDTTNELPLFGKPSNASHGFGARAFLGRANGGLRLRSGEVTGVADAARWISGVARDTGTYLLTELLMPPDELRKVSGDALPSIRFIMLVRDGKPEPFRAMMLFPKTGRETSNVRGFTSGSVVGGIDISSGVITRTVACLGPGMQPSPRHPDTGEMIEGLQLPGWQELLRVAVTASSALAPFHMQHWDFALTSRGPVVIEMNFIGDLELPQLFGPPGMFSEQFRTFWETQRVW